MPKKPISSHHRAARRAISTPPQADEGNAQPARQHTFNAANFTVVRLEGLDEIADLRADLIATYKPVNSQELFAIERVALAQQALLRCYRMEIGMNTAFLNESLDPEGNPLRLFNDELIENIDVRREQNRNFILFEGFCRLNRPPKDIPLFLRMQAQTERLYRRAVEEFERVRSLRGELACQPISEPEPEKVEPPSAPPTNPPDSPTAVPNAPDAPVGPDSQTPLTPEAVLQLQQSSPRRVDRLPSEGPHSRSALCAKVKCRETANLSE